MNSLDALRALSDRDVVSSLDSLAERDRRTGAAIVAHLLVVAERSIHLDLGYSSLVEYCEDRLRCSKDVAYKRAAAVKVASAHPEVLTWLADGDMTLSGLVQLAPHRDDGELVAEARGKSRREIQKLAAARHPDPDWTRIQTRVRSVADGLSKIELTVPDAVLEQIEEALDMDSHIDPSRNVAELLARALATYVTARKRDRFGVTRAPRAPAANRETRRVPAASLRAAYEESGGQCQYVSPEGRRCTARAFLEVDHVVPRAQGGDHHSIRILCRAHNQRAAEIELGTPLMEAARRRARLCRDVKAALEALGFTPAVAGPAAADALDRLGADAALEALLKDALGRTSPPGRTDRGTARTRALVQNQSSAAGGGAGWG